MPLDPRIPLGVQPAQIANPFEQFAQLQHLRGQAEARQADIEERRAAGEARRAAAQEAAAKRAREAQEDQDLATLFATTPQPTLQHFTTIVGPERAVKLAEGIQALRRVEGQQATDARGDAGRLVNGLLALPPAMQTAVWPRVRQAAITGGLGDETTIPETPTPEYLQAVQAWAGEKPPGLQKVTTVNAAGETVETFVTPTEGAEYVQPPPKAATAPTIGSFEDYLARDAAQRGKPLASYTTADIDRARETFRLDQRPSVVVTGGGGGGEAPANVRDAVAAMKAGTVPPILPGRASATYIAVMAEARRQGFDLAGAATDWMATQKHISTMNGAQQLRLNQAVNALPEMLDKVDALATQWKGGNFALLNRANLALAKGGAYGPKAAGIATQLDAQIADVVADLGNVYMGGNSPTDHALQLAGKSLQADWSEPVLHKMVDLAKANVQIRRNSINNTGVAGASTDNPYMPAPPAPPPPPASVPGLTYQDYLSRKK